MTKLIFACDVSDTRTGDELITKIAPEIDMVKIGLEAMTSPAQYGGTVADALFTRSKEMCGKDVMWDIKLLDVANTMKGAARNIVKMGAKLFTIHATASDEALAAVAEAAGLNALALAVTVLTDLDEPQCISRFGDAPAATVLRFARNAHRCGINGFVCSPHEARLIRDALPDAYIVTPGIRPLWSVTPDEQKRVTTPTQAQEAGADAIVVGRPISKPPVAILPHQAARLIRDELDGKLPKGSIVDKKV